MGTLLEFPDMARRAERRIPAIIETMRNAGVKGVDEAWARKWIEGRRASELRLREQIVAGMSREYRFDELARRIAAALAKSPRIPRTEEEQAQVRADLQDRAKTDAMSLLALEMSERIDRAMRSG